MSFAIGGAPLKAERRQEILTAFEVIDDEARRASKEFLKEQQMMNQYMLAEKDEEILFLRKRCRELQGLVDSAPTALPLVFETPSDDASILERCRRDISIVS